MPEIATPRSGWKRAGRLAWLIGPPAVIVLLLAYVGVSRGESLSDAISRVPPWAIAGAVIAHVLTLVLRTEAWRVVLRAAGARLDSRSLHAANAGAFLAGTVQGQAAMPARIALIRRYGGRDAPEVSQIALADAPIFMFEVCTSALLAAVASTAVGVIPAWVPWAMLAGALAVLAGLRVVYGRFRNHRLAAGLGVLADGELRTKLALIVGAFTGMALLRTWIVLAAFGLPADPASVCLVLFSMGTVGLLPIGVGTGPAATVAALGATNLAAATAAGMVVSTATVLAVLVYAGAFWALRSRIPAALPA